MPPRLRAAYSSDAITVKAVSSDGKNTAYVSTAWIHFHTCGMPGSANWWWKPTGTDTSRNIQNDSRASESEKSLPPACFGSMPYHEMYAGSSQKYTSGWPVNQKYVRASSGSVASVMPNFHGRIIVRISVAMPSVAICHMAALITPASAMNGERTPGLSLRHPANVRKKPRPSIQLPTTTSVSPR